jgi:pimeloyl-ACP methyl ester carboxylesterase
MSKVLIKDIELYYEVHGQGKPLLLVTGLASDSQSWQPAINDLIQHFQVIIFDNRGVGRTTPQDIEITIPKMADDCIELIKHLGFKTVNLLGHSMGGMIVQDCAVRYPGYIEKLILSGTSTHLSERSKALLSDWSKYLDAGMAPELWYKNMFYWIFSKKFFDNSVDVEAGLKYAIEYPYPQSVTAFKNQIQALLDYNSKDGISALQSETLVIAGDEDLFFTFEEVRQLSERIPNSNFSLIKNAAHSIHMDNPTDFIDSVVKFL